MTYTKQDIELSAVDREMVSTCLTAQVPEEVVESWEFTSFLLAECVCVNGVGGFCVIRIFPHHVLLVRGTGPLPEEIAFPLVWQPSLCFPSHQSG